MSPFAPKRRCYEAGCGFLGECPRHGRKAKRLAYDQARGPRITTRPRPRNTACRITA